MTAQAEDGAVAGYGGRPSAIKTSEMHTSSLEHVDRLVRKYLDEHDELSVFDLGSLDINGTYKPFFNKPHWRYTGIDLTPGANVDIVLTSPYRLPLPSASADIVISGQAFEHIEFFWLTWLEIARVLKPSGMVFLLAPSRGFEHRFPQDCWRFYPDGYQALAKYAGMELVEVSTDWEPHPNPDSAPWGDTVGVFRQPRLSRLAWMRRRLEMQLLHWLTRGSRGA